MSRLPNIDVRWGDFLKRTEARLPSRTHFLLLRLEPGSTLIAAFSRSTYSTQIRFMSVNKHVHRVHTFLSELVDVGGELLRLLPAQPGQVTDHDSVHHSLLDNTMW